MNHKEQVIFFIGIGGIGMSALARYYLSKGNPVYGYDKTRSELTDALSSEGAVIT
jgi:UDP-N-acetylmuramate--alanine ligase